MYAFSPRDLHFPGRCHVHQSTGLVSNHGYNDTVHRLRANSCRHIRHSRSAWRQTENKWKTWKMNVDSIIERVLVGISCCPVSLSVFGGEGWIGVIISKTITIILLVYYWYTAPIDWVHVPVTSLGFQHSYCSPPGGKRCSYLWSTTVYSVRFPAHYLINSKLIPWFL